MALNINVEFLQDPMSHQDLAVTTPATNVNTPTPTAGMPVLSGNIPGVAEATVDPLTALTPVCTSCVAELSVVASNQSGNVLVAAEDRIYMNASTGVLSKDSTGVLFGTAFGNSLMTSNPTGTDTRTGTLIASGVTATIRVWVGKIN